VGIELKLANTCASIFDRSDDAVKIHGDQFPVWHTYDEMSDIL